jgi:hypothetical protein
MCQSNFDWKVDDELADSTAYPKEQIGLDQLYMREYRSFNNYFEAEFSNYLAGMSS